jgi:hypothetical protein
MPGMMLDPTDLAFFQELAAVCGERLGGDDPCTKAAERAVATGHPNDLRAARLALDALAPALQEAIQRQVHHSLVGNLSMIWDRLPGTPQNGPAN